MINKIEEILENKVRPELLRHNGDIVLVDANDGVVKVKLLGACSHCPSAKYTMEELVEASLKENIPDIKEVILISEVSEDLIQMAKSILGRKDKEK